MRRTNPDSLRSCPCFRGFRLNFASDFFNLLLARFLQTEIIVVKHLHYPRTLQRGLGGSWTINLAIIVVVKTMLRTTRPHWCPIFRRCPIFLSKLKKKVITSEGRSNCAETSQTFRGKMIWRVFTVHNAKKEDIWPFLASSEDKLFLIKNEDKSSKRRTYGKPM